MKIATPDELFDSSKRIAEALGEAASVLEPHLEEWRGGKFSGGFFCVRSLDEGTILFSGRLWELPVAELSPYIRSATGASEPGVLKTADGLECGAAVKIQNFLFCLCGPELTRYGAEGICALAAHWEDLLDIGGAGEISHASNNVLIEFIFLHSLLTLRLSALRT